MHQQDRVSLTCREIGLDNVPYFSQRLTETNYVEEGFPSLDKASRWSTRICGLACMKMAIAYFREQEPPTLYHLLEKGLELGAYKSGVGWIHTGLVAIAHYYGLNTGRYGIGDTLDPIVSELSRNHLVIASVSPAFEGGMTYYDEVGTASIVEKGGHLVLVTHATLSGETVSGVQIHHPSSLENYEWESRKISSDTFLRSFSGNIIYVGA